MGLDDFKLTGESTFNDSLSKAKKIAIATGLAITTALTGCGNQDNASEICTNIPRTIIVSKKPDGAMSNPIKIQNKTTGQILYISKYD